MKAGVDGTYGYLRYDTTPYFGIVECKAGDTIASLPSTGAFAAWYYE